MSYQTIDGGWRDYALACLPEDASRDQRVETRRAFYAGATALLTLIGRRIEPGGSMEENIRRMNALQAEVQRALMEIAAGRDRADA